MNVSLSSKRKLIKRGQMRRTKKALMLICVEIKGTFSCMTKITLHYDMLFVFSNCCFPHSTQLQLPTFCELFVIIK